MTTTARTQTRQIADNTTDLAALVITDLDDFVTCQLCGHDTAELYTRLDLTDLAEIDVCETCADTADDLAHVAD
jgi:hypothetical protein